MKRFSSLLVAGMFGVIAASQATAATTAKMTLSASIVEDSLTLSVATSPSLGKIAVPAAFATTGWTLTTNDDGVLVDGIDTPSTALAHGVSSMGGCRNGKVKVVATHDSAQYSLTTLSTLKTNILGSGVLSLAGGRQYGMDEGREKTHTTPITVTFGTTVDKTDSAGTITFVLEQPPVTP
jgi:hypothetical protein